MEKKKTKKEKLKLIQELANKLLELVGSSAKAVVSEDEENDAFLVDIQTENEAGLLIGNRGRTLNSIQTALGIIVRRQTGEWERIIVNVADWRERETQRLEELANQVADRAKTTRQPQSLYNLTPSQRRIIHLALADNPEVKTESQGEGKERFLVVSPKE